MKADQIEATWQKMGTVNETAVPYYLMLIAAQLADHTDLNRQVLGLWKTIRDAQNERGTAELEAKRLRELCGSVYQFIGANMHKLGGCRRFLDALSNASNGLPFDVEHLLPYDAEEPVCMTDVAQPTSAEPKGDVAAEKCKDLLVADHSTIIPDQFAPRLNSAVIEAFLRGREQGRQERDRQWEIRLGEFRKDLERHNLHGHYNLFQEHFAEPMAERYVAGAAYRELMAAAQAHVTALEACEPAISNAFGFSAIHGGNYTGPTYGKELTALKAALAALQAQDAELEKEK